MNKEVIIEKKEILKDNTKGKGSPKMNIKKTIKIYTKIIVTKAIAGVTTIFGINYYVKKKTKKFICKDEKSNEKAKENKINKIKDAQCILVFGAGVRNGKPTIMLEDRVNKAVELYKNGVCKKIIMSGDHGRDDYDEVNIMKECAIKKGVPSSDIFMDHAGFSTYDTIYRARDVFGINKIILVTQEYHAYRSLYIAKRLGLDAYAVCTIKRIFLMDKYRNAREVLARNKDFFKCIIKPRPKFLGKRIGINGDGNVTNDKERYL